jgi:hypothetical protein
MDAESIIKRLLKGDYETVTYEEIQWYKENFIPNCIKCRPYPPQPIEYVDKLPEAFTTDEEIIFKLNCDNTLHNDISDISQNDSNYQELIKQLHNR